MRPTIRLRINGDHMASNARQNERAYREAATAVGELLMTRGLGGTFDLFVIGQVRMAGGIGVRVGTPLHRGLRICVRTRGNDTAFAYALSGSVRPDELRSRLLAKPVEAR